MPCDATAARRQSERQPVDTMASETVDLLYVCISMLLLSFAGLLSARFRIIEPKTGIPVLSKFVFDFSLPALAFMFLATKDFDTLDWDFAAIFFCFRGTVALLVLLLCPLFRLLSGTRPYKQFPKSEEYVTHFICSSWISPVIYGLPVLLKLYPPATVKVLPVLASLSSLLFQLPLMISLYDHSKVRRETAGGLTSEEKDRVVAADSSAVATAEVSPEQLTVDLDASDAKPRRQDAVRVSGEVCATSDEVAVAVAQSAEAFPSAGTGRMMRPTWQQMLLRSAKVILTNKIIIGTLLGILWSVTEIGTVPDIILDYCSFLADTVTPVSMFSVGLFLYQEGWPWKNAHFREMWQTLSVYWIIKFVACPLIAVGYIESIGVGNVEARAAVLLSALPISVAAFTISSKYDANPNIVALSIVTMNTLMPVVQVIVYAVMDAADYRPTS